MPIKPSIALLLLCALSSQLYADDHEEDERDDDDDNGHVSLGLLVGSGQSLYVGGEEKVEVFPFVRAEWGRWSLEGPGIGYTLYESAHWRVATALEMNLGSSDRDASPQLSDMNTLDDVVRLGLSAGYEADWGEVEFSVGSDVSGVHDGNSVSLSYGYPLRSGRWFAEPEIEATWLSEEVNQYHYGVSAKDAKLGRPVYRPGAGVNYGLSVSLGYMFDRQQGMLLRAEITQHADQITESPIVDRDTSSGIGIGYFYRF